MTSLREDSGLVNSAALLRGHNGPVNSVASSPDGKLIVSAGEDGTVRVWDACTENEAIPYLRGHAGVVFCVAMSPAGGKLIASAGHDETVRVWNALSEREQKTMVVFRGHSAPVSACCLLSRRGADRELKF